MMGKTRMGKTVRSSTTRNSGKSACTFHFIFFRFALADCLTDVPFHLSRRTYATFQKV